MKHNNCNVMVVIIISIVFSTMTSAQNPINTNFHNCDINMNKYFGDWHNSLLSCVQRALTDLNSSSFTGKDEEVDVINYFKKFSSLVSPNFIRDPSQFCQETYQANSVYKEDCTSDLEEKFGKDTSKEDIFKTALFGHKQLKYADIAERNPATTYRSNTFLYHYLDDIASLITSSAGMNKHFKDWNYSVFNTVHHAITDMLWEDFDDEDYTRNLFKELSHSVSAEHIRYPFQFCPKHCDDDQESEDCVFVLNDAFKIDEGSTKQGILNMAILNYKQAPDADEDEIQENSEIDIEYGITLHESNSFIVNYLKDIASRIIIIGGRNDFVTFQSPLHYCSFFHNKPLFFQLLTR